MRAEVAQALEGLVGGLMAQGMELGIAERVARVKAFDSGTWEGDICGRCYARTALLWRGGVCWDCLEAEEIMTERRKRLASGLAP